MVELRVVVADDHPVFRGGLRAALADVPDVVVVAEASTGADAVAAALQHQADVVLMDLSMPGGSGVDATAELARRRPATAVIVLTMHDDAGSLTGAIAAGARGYLVKGAAQGEIVRAIRAVAAGDLLFGGPVAQHVLGAMAALPRRGRTPAFPSVTGRELEILDLVARGLTNGVIAKRLVISEKTVRNHVSNLLTKLGCESRAAAVAMARDAGLGAGCASDHRSPAPNSNLPPTGGGS